MENKQLEEKIKPSKEKLDLIFTELKKEITGQEHTVKKIVLGLISQGHILLEGMPGLAKTLLAKSIASALNLSFNRIQFTPDLLPADLIGTVVFNPKTADFMIRKGPIFTGILLADEINRSPAKVQSALLQCMGERMVTIGDTTFKLDSPFMVIATENPIDQEGTYQLPEAQMDRFLMKVNVGYPNFEEELSILDQHGDSGETDKGIQKILNAKDILQIYKITNSIYIDPKLQEYIVKIVRSTRPETSTIEDVKPYIKHGASPRASLSLLRVSKAHAFLAGRSFVTPEDIQYAMYDILRHRLILTFEAVSEEVSVDSLIKTIIESVELP